VLGVHLASPTVVGWRTSAVSAVDRSSMVPVHEPR